MKVVKVQFHPADREYFFLPEFSEEKSEVKLGQPVMVRTILGDDIGIVREWADWQPRQSESEKKSQGKNPNNLEQKSTDDIKPMLRVASAEDLAKAKDIEDKYSEYLKTCQEFCKKHGLKNMRLVDVHESYDRERLTYYFVASNRVDFRELVKDLVKKYHKKIRLQQIGVRDAARMEGDFGPCGLPLCCRCWLENIGNVSPDFISNQNLNHRGADRLTGPCGRLKCCLRFEEESYKYNKDKLPEIGESISTAAGKGKVIAVHPLKQTVELEIDGAVVEYPYLEGKLCQKSEK